MRYLVPLFFVSLVFALPPLSDTKCGFMRDDAFQCIRHFADTNKNEAVSREEVDAVISKYAPWYIRAAAFFVGTDRIFKDCDYDNNGVLTARDWKLAPKCLPKPENLCTLKWFCDRARKEEEKETK